MREVAAPDGKAATEPLAQSRAAGAHKEPRTTDDLGRHPSYAAKVATTVAADEGYKQANNDEGRPDKGALRSQP